MVIAKVRSRSLVAFRFDRTLLIKRIRRDTDQHKGTWADTHTPEDRPHAEGGRGRKMRTRLKQKLLRKICGLNLSANETGSWKVLKVD